MSQPQPEGPPKTWDEYVYRTLDSLHEYYDKYVKPLEEKYKYEFFHPSYFEETLQTARPFVSFFGPFSAGKTTFLNYLLEGEHLWTGPQPTTSDFTVLVHGDEPGPLDGRVLVNAKDLPFKGLSQFGEGFLHNFKGYQVPHDILKSMILVDTPGVLESAKDIHQRNYDYIKLSRWFAERSDLIFFLFDPSKMDAGIEMKMLFKHAFKGFESKVRIVLNKADTISTQELMRVYGSLFWNLSNMVSTTEPPRVYIGSFWDRPYSEGTFHYLFEKEKVDLIHELTTIIPGQALDRKIAALIKRAKDVEAHSLIVGGLRSKLPMMFGKDKAKKHALDNWQKTIETIANQYRLNWRDFPPVSEYQQFFAKQDLESFPELEKVEKDGKMKNIRHLISVLLPQMIKPAKSAPLLDPRDKVGRKQLADSYSKPTGQQSSPYSAAASLNASQKSPQAPSPPAASSQAAPNPNEMMQQMMSLMMQMSQSSQAPQAPPNSMNMPQMPQWTPQNMNMSQNPQEAPSVNMPYQDPGSAPQRSGSPNSRAKEIDE